MYICIHICVCDAILSDFLCFCLYYCCYSVFFHSPKPISITVYRDSFTGTLPYNLLNYRAREDCLKKTNYDSAIFPSYNP